jgi:hypothetical protein
MKAWEEEGLACGQLRTNGCVVIVPLTWHRQGEPACIAN